MSQASTAQDSKNVKSGREEEKRPTLERLQGLAGPSMEILDSLAALRSWRERVRSRGESVGFVPTMGALHQGHLDLVRHSLASNDQTVVSIFVNPAQFAPHEDLGTYPRTMEQDVRALQAVKMAVRSPSSNAPPTTRMASAIFVPRVSDMYPSGITQDVEAQKGTFVYVKGYEHEMEGRSRPGFFRGVATVVLKLFNAVEPTDAYFGQKDIQQALLLKRLCRDLLLSHPSPERLHIVPTTRDEKSRLALSSRNAYLSEVERTKWAPVLINALTRGRRVWNGGHEGKQKQQQAQEQRSVGVRALEAKESVEAVLQGAVNSARSEGGVGMRMDYVSVNWADTFEVVGPDERVEDIDVERRGVILSGALWVGKTRLIDNVIVAGESWILG